MTTNVYWLSVGFNTFEDITFESIPKAMELIQSHTNNLFEVDVVEIPRPLSFQIMLTCKEFNFDFDSFVSACVSIGREKEGI